MNQACFLWFFKERELIKQNGVGEYLRAQVGIFTHMEFSLYFYGSLSPQTPLKGSTALKHTVSVFFSKWKKPSAPEALYHPFSMTKNG